MCSFLNFFKGSIAQLVEQRIENPCVGGSIPSRATFQGGKLNDNNYNYTSNRVNTFLSINFIILKKAKSLYF